MSWNICRPSSFCLSSVLLENLYCFHHSQIMHYNQIWKKKEVIIDNFIHVYNSLWSLNLYSDTSPQHLRLSSAPSDSLSHNHMVLFGFDSLNLSRAALVSMQIELSISVASFPVARALYLPLVQQGPLLRAVYPTSQFWKRISGDPVFMWRVSEPPGWSHGLCLCGVSTAASVPFLITVTE